jgi:hypothetical protein
MSARTAGIASAGIAMILEKIRKFRKNIKNKEIMKRIQEKIENLLHQEKIFGEKYRVP